MAAGGGPTAIRPPGYPVLLAGVLGVSGGSLTAGRVASAVLGTVAVALLGLIARQLWDTRTALASLALGALTPPLLAVATTLVSENLSLALLLGAVASVLAHRRSHHQLRWAASAGVLIGLATLTRSNAAIVVVPLTAGLFLRVPRLRFRDLAPALALVGAAVVAIAPWTIRNVIVLDAFVPVSTQASYTLAGSYNEAGRTDTRFPYAWRPANLSPEYAQVLRREEMNEVELGRELGAAVREHLGGHPESPLAVAFWNSVRLLHLHQLEYSIASARSIGVRRWPATAAILGFYPLALLALAGAFTRRARAAPRFLWAIPVLLWAVVFVGGFLRYRTPVDAFLVLLAAAALAAGLDRLDARRVVRGASARLCLAEAVQR